MSKDVGVADQLGVSYRMLACLPILCHINLVIQYNASYVSFLSARRFTYHRSELSFINWKEIRSDHTSISADVETILYPIFALKV